MHACTAVYACKDCYKDDQTNRSANVLPPKPEPYSTMKQTSENDMTANHLTSRKVKVQIQLVAKIFCIEPACSKFT